jgi:hypothetical protein
MDGLVVKLHHPLHGSQGFGQEKFVGRGGTQVVLAFDDEIVAGRFSGEKIAEPGV